MEKRIELLAPAGNMDALQAAVAAGADAIYLGGTLFSARAFAGNFDHETMIEAISYCHIRGVKVYVTMNTLMNEYELENAMKEVDFLYQNDVDAILVQDFGLFHRIREEYKDLEVHASTQMHVHNVNGCKFLKEQGASRVVLARETPLEVIEACCKSGIEVEVFSYGAICVSYSGQCQFSSVTHGRSGNKGTCAQCCRMKYKPMVNGKEVESETGEYLLSPKDLNAISSIPALIEMGVSSLKIEGRMKRKEYVYLVTKTFREAIDAYYANKDYTISEERLNQLKVMFNRGFSEGHLNHASVEQRMNHKRPNHQGTMLGKVVDTKYGKVKIKLKDDLHQQDGIRILNGKKEDIGLIANKIELNGLLVNSAKKNEVVVLTCRNNDHPKVGSIVLKTTDAKLIEDIDREIKQTKRCVPITMEYRCLIGNRLYVKAMDDLGNVVEVFSEDVVEQAKKAPMTQDKFVSKLEKVGDYPFAIDTISGEFEECFMAVSKINETRRILLDALVEKRKVMHTRSGKVDYAVRLEKKANTLPRLVVEGYEGVDDAIFMPFTQTHLVNENEDTKDLLDTCLIKEVGQLYQEKKNCIASITMNVANSYALAFLYQLEGIEGVIFSTEVNNDFIKKALDAFEMRYGFVLPTYRYVYGRRSLMHIKDRFTNQSIDAIQALHGEVYPVVEQDGITLVLEEHPYGEENPYCYGGYVKFTLETEVEQKHILNQYKTW